MYLFLQGIFPHIFHMSWIATSIFLCFLFLSKTFGKKQTKSFQFTCLKGILLLYLCPVTLLFQFFLMETTLPERIQEQLSSQNTTTDTTPYFQSVTEDSIMTGTPDTNDVTDTPSTNVTETPPTFDASLPSETMADVGEIHSATPPSLWESFSFWFTLTYPILWFMGVVILSIWFLGCHLAFTLSKKSKVPLDLSTPCPLPVYIQENLHSPVLFGVFFPKIFFPSSLFREKNHSEDFPFILSHELIHHQRKDLWFKSVLLLVKILHWFNPLVYLFALVFEEILELSCDEVLVKDMDFQARKSYSLAVISVMEEEISSVSWKLATPLGVGFAKLPLKNRMEQMFHSNGREKPRKRDVIFCVTFLLFVLTGFSVCQLSVYQQGKNSLEKILPFTQPSRSEQLEHGQETLWGNEYTLVDSDTYLLLLDDSRYYLYVDEDTQYRGTYVGNIMDQYIADFYNRTDIAGTLFLYDQEERPRFSFYITSDGYLEVNHVAFDASVLPRYKEWIGTAIFQRDTTNLSNSLRPLTSQEQTFLDAPVEIPYDYYLLPFNSDLDPARGIWDKMDGYADYHTARYYSFKEELQSIEGCEDLDVNFTYLGDRLRLRLFYNRGIVTEEIVAEMDAILQSLKREGEIFELSIIQGLIDPVELDDGTTTFQTGLYLIPVEEGMPLGTYTMTPEGASNNWKRSITLGEGGTVSIPYSHGGPVEQYGHYYIEDNLLYIYNDMMWISNELLYIFEVDGESTLSMVYETPNITPYTLEGEDSLKVGDTFHLQSE